jgi:hypothetical protein
MLHLVIDKTYRASGSDSETNAKTTSAWLARIAVNSIFFKS